MIVLLQEVSANAAILTGGSVAIAIGLVEVIKSLITKVTNSNGNGKSFNLSDRAKLNELHNWHAPSQEGRQDWKNPDLHKTLIEIRDVLRRIEAKDHGPKGRG